MDLFQAMQVFRRVVELEGFSAAARDRRISNAAVSKQVAALEDRLATKLLVRTTRRVALTSEGAAYYARCVQILDELDELERSLVDKAAQPSGTLRVNAPTAFGQLHLAPLLPELLERWPDLRLEVGFSDRFIDVVEEGVDVVVRVASELPDSATLIMHKLARARHVVCASPRYLREHGEPRTPAELVEHECIVYGRGRSPGEWSFRGPEGDVRVRVEGRLRVDNSLVIRDMLVASLGISLLPAFYVGEQLRKRQLRVILVDYEPPPLFVHALYSHTKHLSAKVRVFVELLRERFSAAEWAVPR